MAKKIADAPLLTLLQPKQDVSYHLFIEPVPAKQAIAPDRFWIVSVRKCGDEVVAIWKIPVQWTREEASLLINHIRSVGWQLKEDDIYEGRPYCVDEVDFVCEQFCKTMRRAS